MVDSRAALGGLQRQVDRHWLRWSILIWLMIAVFYFWQRWPYIYWLALRDTDDNMRLMQVRALLSGQGWFDLTQYRLNPPTGFNIHWSRIVDLPIAGLILWLRLFTSNYWAERIATGIAPLLPLSIVIASMAYTVRKLVAPLAWPLTVVLLLVGCNIAMLMFMPMRIDHHGWQLAALTLTGAGLVDERKARSGAIIGLSSAFSLSIGLEMLPYCAIAGAILTLRWIIDRDDARRLGVYGLTLAGGTALGFAGFASNANHAMRCDALTPVYLSTMVTAGTLLFLMALLNPRHRLARLGVAGVAGIALGAGFALTFPQCLGRPEQASPELYRIWLDNVREAKPIYKHPLRDAIGIATFPAIGLIGTLLATWKAWRERRFMLWLPTALFSISAGAMLFWQVRAGPAAQLMALPGATALGWIVIPWFLRQKSAFVRIFGAAATFVAISGLIGGFAVQWFHIDKPSKRYMTIRRANAKCASYSRLIQLNRIPKQIMFTHVDLGPRLITVTHHDAVAGPYHRNGQAILDVHHAFMGTPQQFLAIAKRHHATMLLTCPNMSETTVYRARSPHGFYGQLAHGKVPGFLKPVELPEGSPFKLWRIDYGAAAKPSEKAGAKPVDDELGGKGR
ncbi:AcrB/AcrD/AcrF family protein [Stakelama marina]|uniref:AcrB/AcrD/AcrF family protein n=1 Tax=Stakelama marina TaxID=2826939 RepID=UPI0024C401D9|nr:AcrB/AcrD/AcrF family protein [Stakelama marina]